LLGVAENGKPKTPATQKASAYTLEEDYVKGGETTLKGTKKKKKI